ncbi:MAG: PAS domain S-box protein, partial [bacterium]|nr:PAS domain S-box protein [bacterium]
VDEDKTREQLLKELEALKQRMPELETSENKYQTLFTQMIDGYALHEIICDHTGNPVDYRFLDLNPAFERLTGLTKDIIGKTVREVIPGIEDYWINTYGEVALTGKSVKFENYADPLKKWFEIVAFRPEENRFACIFIDITERKLAEEELKRLRSLLSNIVNSMPSVLIGVDPAGCITQWNREAEKTTGVPANKAQGCSLADVFPQMAGQMENIRQTIRRRQPRKDQKVANVSHGETHFSDVTIYPLVSNGIEGAVIRIDDVTERVHIEEMMIQSEKMLSVGGLAAGMAHEINNPLAGILQNVQVIRNRLKSNLPKNIKTAETCGISMEAIEAYMERRGIFSMLESVVEAGRRAAQVVDNMLSFSRKSESKGGAQDLGELLDKSVELASKDYDLKKKYDFRYIQIIREYLPDMPAVWCERTKIQQVFLNLLKNGAQAMAENKKENEGEPQRFVLRVLLDEEESEKNMARVEIEDNGPGMDEHTRKRIFEPFFTTKGTGAGTGLGLSVSYFIITENHRGTMTVESSPGKGTKFIIRLPIKKQINIM